LVVIGRQLKVFFENEPFVAAVFIQANLADPENVRLGEKIRDEGDDVIGEGSVFGFLGVDAEPSVMREVIFGGTPWLVFGELQEIVVKTVGVFPVVAGPEGGFADSGAAGGDHGSIVIGGAANHVSVGFDVAHGGERLRCSVDVFQQGQRGRNGTGQPLSLAGLS
jgi:hypothetical protein